MKVFKRHTKAYLSEEGRTQQMKGSDNKKKRTNLSAQAEVANCSFVKTILMLTVVFLP